MPREFGRHRRVADQIQREMAAILQKYAQGPASGLLTVSTVDVSPDLRNARVYVTCLDNQTEAHAVIEDLNEMAGQFRRELAKTSTMRYVPKLDFRFDETLKHANYLTSLIDSLHTDKKTGSDSDT